MSEPIPEKRLRTEMLVSPELGRILTGDASSGKRSGNLFWMMSRGPVLCGGSRNGPRLGWRMSTRKLVVGTRFIACTTLFACM